jgi:hypothetical protein
MKGSGDDYELDNDDEDYELDDNDEDYELDDDGEDYEELSEPVGAPDEKVRIWLASSFSSGEITSSSAENKGNSEMLADMRGVVSL